ncbi:hypothetical protein Cgig2_033832 [Carnegiea gigantea]|uniref:Uncharacterized protein n=1 Tax=Carnegiea gigantea TaxID=171969 RepID=A0A9Q1JT37_9CARY|nr:hypothetical protein Cgig2_033832 [Carnegiea gigantea]
MGENPQYIDVNELLSYSNDLVGVLRDKRDINILTHCLDDSKSLRSASDADFNATQIAISIIVNKMNELDNQQLSTEEQRQRLKKLEAEEDKEQRLPFCRRKLSFYASVTKIIPDLESQSNICGRILIYHHIVERDRKVVEKFEFDPTEEDSFDICNNIWKMINR